MRNSQSTLFKSIIKQVEKLLTNIFVSETVTGLDLARVFVLLFLLLPPPGDMICEVACHACDDVHFVTELPKSEENSKFCRSIHL
jgi:hypothetical protein